MRTVCCQDDEEDGIPDDDMEMEDEELEEEELEDEYPIDQSTLAKQPRPQNLGYELYYAQEAPPLANPSHGDPETDSSLGTVGWIAYHKKECQRELMCQRSSRLFFFHRNFAGRTLLNYLSVH